MQSGGRTLKTHNEGAGTPIPPMSRRVAEHGIRTAHEHRKGVHTVSHEGNASESLRKTTVHAPE